MYNGSVWTFSDMSYEQLSTEENEQLQAGGIIRTEASMASPSISRYVRVYCCLQYLLCTKYNSMVRACVYTEV